MPTRKSATALTDDERDSLLMAVMRMKGTVASMTDPDEPQRITLFDQFVAIHTGCLNVTVPSGDNVNMGHQGPAFLPWHREFLLRFEQKLVEHGSTTGLPYWDWTDHVGTSTKLFTDDFLGARDGLINTGYFGFDAPDTGTNNFPRPQWWPPDLAGWRIRPSLAGRFGTTLRRVLDERSLAVPEDVRRTMSKPIYEDSTKAVETDPLSGEPDSQPKGFRNRLEAGRRMHNFGHGWVGGRSGHMGSPLTSPNDLIFFLHHCNIDRLWAEWQGKGHQGVPHYPGPQSGEDEGHKLTDAMWPWVGARPGYDSALLPSDSPIPDFTAEPERTPADVLDHSALECVVPCGSSVSLPKGDQMDETLLKVLARIMHQGPDPGRDTRASVW